jgi:hypothetical protein
MSHPLARLSLYRRLGRRLGSRGLLVGSLLLVGSIACTPTRVGSGDDGDGTEPGTMMMMPPSTQAGTVVITPNPVNIDATTSDMKVQLRAVSTSLGDITKKASWTLSDSGVGVIQAGLLTVRSGINRGGKVSLYASYGIQTGVGIVNIKFNAPDVIESGAPPNAKDYFSGSDGGPAPSWVYPLERTILPKNLGQVNLQWNAAGSAVVYRIHIESSLYARNIYLAPTVCSGGRCQYTASDALWAEITASLAGGDATFTLSSSGGVGEPFGSAPRQISFSPEDVKGGLYYWSTTITGIYRVPLGAKTAQVFINRGNEFGCSGCHAVSRDGKKVALEFGSADGVGGGIVDGADGTKYVVKPPSSGQWNLQSFSPMGDMLIVNWQQQARIIDSTTGQKLFDVPVRMAQPEWSPDGKNIVYVSYPAGGSGEEWNANNIGDIMTIPFNGGAFGAPSTIVPLVDNKEYHFYPSWTPDSKWIVFNTGKVPCKGGGGCNTYDPTNTVLRIVKAAPGSKPLELARAGYMGNSGTNWPRVTPFIQGGKLIFFTFSARFPYGFVKSGNNPQIWMAGVDLEKAENKPDEDPSFAPFWLPFQNPSESNHLGTWTTDVKCMSDAQCPSEFRCMGGSCVPPIG